MKKLGKQTIKFDVPPSIVSVASIVGPKEDDRAIIGINNSLET